MVWVVQHISCETPGIIADALREKGITPRHVRTFARDRVPQGIGEAAGLILMGGPMGVYEQDRYPFLRDEIALIQSALENKRPVLGICLGSQLLAAALGAEVKKGRKKEIGWHAVTLSQAAAADPLWRGIEPRFTAYHWHGDRFELPAGAVSLASSALTECQAFRFGSNAYGFLFHMEVTQKIIEDMVETFSDELKKEGMDGVEIIEQAKEYLTRLQAIGSSVFERWAGLLRRS